MIYFMYPYKKVPAWFCEYESKNPIGLFRHMCFGLAYRKDGMPHCYMLAGKAVIFIKDSNGLNVWPKFKLYSSFTDWLKGAIT